MFNKVLLVLTLSKKTDCLLEVFYSLCVSPETEVFLLPPWTEAEEAARIEAMNAPCGVPDHENPGPSDPAIGEVAYPPLVVCINTK